MRNYKWWRGLRRRCKYHDPAYPRWPPIRYVVPPDVQYCRCVEIGRPPERIVITLKHRPMWQRVLLFPRTFLGHYLIFRRTRVSVRTSVVASWGLARLLFLRVE